MNDFVPDRVADKSGYFSLLIVIFINIILTHSYFKGRIPFVQIHIKEIIQKVLFMTIFDFTLN